MSDIYVVEIESSSGGFLEIESGSYADLPNISLEILSSETVLDIINTEFLLASDLPDNIPMTKITGMLDVNRISGLDNYLSNFIDTYEIDCGTP